MIAAAQPLLLDAAPFERGAAIRVMRVEGADPPVPVAEHDNLSAAIFNQIADSRLVLLSTCGRWPPFTKLPESPTQLLAFLRGC